MKILTEYEIAIQESLRYLNSDDAIRSIEADPYWPKWNSPWWHMTLLYEMGLAKRIPARVARKMTDQLKAHYLDIFPIRPEELPEGVDPFRGTMCHCALGNIYQTLAACGIDIDQEVPWSRRQPASLFPLLEQVSQSGTMSPDLTSQWVESRQMINELDQRGLILGKTVFSPIQGEMK